MVRTIRQTALRALALAVLVFAGATVLVAQPGPMGPGPSIDKAGKAEIIDSVTAALNQYYVFPDVAKKMEQHARAQLKNGAYDKFATVGEFARGLTEDLLTICNDRHFGMRFMPREDIEAMLDTVNRPTAEEELLQERRGNFGFREVKQLPGNIGYLKFNQFSGAPEARETAVAAMNFLGNSDALIIDLRENGGGDPVMIGLLSSYFFDEPVHLNTFYIRETDSLQQFWTSAHVDGPRMGETPIYVLTGNYSFSGAEEFTYNLKNLKRATIVGETTGGGAHPVATHGFANLQVVVRVPFGRAINPITGTNWEGTGVEPDIQCPADQALTVAQMEALKMLREKNASDEQLTAQYDWGIAGLQAEVNPVVLSESELLVYVGDFGPRHVRSEAGGLVYQREDGPKHPMTPMGNDLFGFADIPYFRLQFIKDDFGKVVAVEGRYDNGMVDRNEKTS